MNSYGDELEQEPTSAEAYNERGWLKYEQKDYAGAILDYDKAIELDPAFVDAYNNRGIANRITLARYSITIRHLSWILLLYMLITIEV